MPSARAAHANFVYAIPLCANVSETLPCLYNQSHFIGLSKLVEQVHMLGAKMFFQISFGQGRQVQIKRIIDPTADPVSASPVGFRIKREGLPLKALEQFKKRALVGPDYVIGVRLSLDEHVPGGLTLQDTIEICKEVENLGMDYILFSDGCYEAFKYFEPDEDGTMLDEAAEVKKVVKIPVITPSIHDPDMAEKAVAQGQTDMIGLGRALLADAEWPNKVSRGELPVKCIRCNVGCWGRLLKGLPIRCTVNPELGFEQYVAKYRPPAVKREAFKLW